ncbi:MAG: hypothetical protein MR533_09975 [Prevotella sp.]|nr:hypothetical protein [Prevotella sp.]
MGVFGLTDSQQVPIYMLSGAGTQEATFSSSSFQLKKDEQYVAYYPIVDKVTAKPIVPVDYTGQTQVSVSAMQPFFLSLCLLPLLQHY